MSKIPSGLTVIYFNDKEKNIYAELPPDNEQEKKLSKRNDSHISRQENRRAVNSSRLFACHIVYNPIAAIPLGNNIQAYSPVIFPCSYLSPCGAPNQNNTNQDD